jgi:cysteine desulfurase
MEHHAVLHTLEECAKKGKVQLHLLDVNEFGDIDMQQLEELMVKYPKALVSLMHANNEIGNINDIQAIGALARQHGAFFHSDTVQTMGHFVHDLKALPVDSIVAGGHKFHGPKGSGFLICQKR